jgi:flagellar hook-length control protein FliK
VSFDAARLSPEVLSSGRTQRLVLDVDPPHLGPCELELTMRDGEVRATILAHRSETAAAMRSVEDQVRVQLARKGLDVTQFDVRGGLDQGPAQGETAHQGRWDAPPHVRRFLQETAPDTHPRRPLTTTGATLVDLTA